MTAIAKKITDLVNNELSLLWMAHHNVGLEGYMCLYTNAEQTPFRSKEGGLQFWFGPNDNQAAINYILEHYNNGRLPNSPLLLNPIVHRKNPDDTYTPLGSGVIWCTGLSLGVDVFSDHPSERFHSLGIFTGHFQRGENNRAGIKVLGFADSIQQPKEDGRTVTCCQELYELADIKCDQYALSYFLSGINYLTNNGLFEQPNIEELFPSDVELDAAFIKEHSVSATSIMDSAKCWNAYDRHHSLYKKFGNDISHIDENLRFFNMVARDVALFDATGTARESAENTFDFIVHGLIPRGAVTLIAAAGGTGKSSVAHKLCAIAASDYPADAEQPKWLGQTVDIHKCKGISIFFSGEDGPQIFNARSAILDPEGKAKRIMFQRTDFGEGVSFAQHLRNLHKIPDVPIIVVDPARKYLIGDENEASAVSEFFDALENFAIEKNTAVVVIHHLQKGASPKTSLEAIDMLSGSQVFVDRPRVVIGMFRDGPYTVVGLAKNNIPPNFGMMVGERVFARDPETLSLVWLPGKAGIRNAPLSHEELEELAKKSNNNE